MIITFEFLLVVRVMRRQYILFSSDLCKFFILLPPTRTFCLRDIFLYFGIQFITLHIFIVELARYTAHFDAPHFIDPKQHL